MIKKNELLDLIIDTMNNMEVLQEDINKLEKRVKKLEPKKERKSAKKVSK